MTKQSNRFIMKVQRPLFRTDDGPERVLVYDEAREWHGILKWTELPPSVKEALGHEPKAYFHCAMQGTRVIFGQQAPEQKW